MGTQNIHKTRTITNFAQVSFLLLPHPEKHNNSTFVTEGIQASSTTTIPVLHKVFWPLTQQQYLCYIRCSGLSHNNNNCVTSGVPAFHTTTRPVLRQVFKPLTQEQHTCSYKAFRTLTQKKQSCSFISPFHFHSQLLAASEGSLWAWPLCGIFVFCGLCAL